MCLPGYYEDNGVCVECARGTYRSGLGDALCDSCGALKTTIVEFGNVDVSACGE